MWDVFCGDIDGVLVVPRAIACDILVRAEEITKKGDTFDWLQPGKINNGAPDAEHTLR